MINYLKNFFSWLLTVLGVIVLFGCTQPTDLSLQESLLIPTNVTVKEHENKLNTVTVTWEIGTEKSEYYWIYYSRTNDTTALTSPQVKQISYSSWDEIGTCDIVLNESGTYYFWVKAANDYSSDSASSDFSLPASYDFVLEYLTVPANLTAEKFGTTPFSGIKLSWNSTNAPYYQIYWATTDKFETAKKLTTTSITWDKLSESVYNWEKGKTYYFWVKSANGFSETEVDSDFCSGISYTYN